MERSGQSDKVVQLMVLHLFLVSPCLTLGDTEVKGYGSNCQRGKLDLNGSLLYNLNITFFRGSDKSAYKHNGISSSVQLTDWLCRYIGQEEEFQMWK